MKIKQALASLAQPDPLPNRYAEKVWGQSCTLAIILEECGSYYYGAHGLLDEMTWVQPQSILRKRSNHQHFDSQERGLRYVHLW